MNTTILCLLLAIVALRAFEIYTNIRNHDELCEQLAQLRHSHDHATYALRELADTLESDWDTDDLPSTADIPRHIFDTPETKMYGQHP